MSDGKIFSRVCKVCFKRHQTADQTGETPCPDCESKSAVKAKKSDAPATPAVAENKPKG